jgi:hypothetical protein
VPIAEHDLGVRPHVDEQLGLLGPVRPFGQDRARRVGADVTGDARADVHTGIGQRDIEFVRRCHDGAIGGERERCLSERRRVDAEHDVVHDRVADEHDFEHAVARVAGALEQLADELVERGTHGLGQLAIAAGVHHHVRDPAHQVLAEPDLRVHPSGAGEHLA